MSRFLHVCTFVIFLVFGVEPALAQETTEVPTSPPGYDDPDDVTDIEQYRLPAWSFTTILFDVSGGAQRSSRSSEDTRLPLETDDTLSNYRINLNPSLTTFTESEDRRFRLDVGPGLFVRRDGQTQSENGDEIGDGNGSNLATRLTVDVGLTEYIAGDLFVQVQSDNLAAYRRNSVERTEVANGSETQVVDRQSTTVTYESDARLGVGFGRLRDVTPVIRALRVRERLQEIGRGDALGRENIQAAAQQFARRPGYAPVYDRSDKYFWNDFFSAIEAQGGDLQAYETFYIAESLIEQVSRRREGYEVAAGVDLRYTNALDKEENTFGPDVRSREINSDVGFFARGRYATNLSLRQQVDVQLDATYVTPTDDNTSVDGVFETTAEAAHLWEIADRYQVTSTGVARYQEVQRDDGEGDDFTSFRFSAGSSFAMFVENRVRLSAGLRYALDISESGPQRDTINDIRFSFGVDYFLFRGLN